MKTSGFSSMNNNRLPFLVFLPRSLLSNGTFIFPTLIDPNLVQLTGAEDKRRTHAGFVDKAPISIEQGGVLLKTVCRKCGASGHLATECFSAGEKFELLEDDDDDNYGDAAYSGTGQEKGKDKEKKKKSHKDRSHRDDGKSRDKGRDHDRHRESSSRRDHKDKNESSNRRKEKRHDQSRRYETT